MEYKTKSSVSDLLSVVEIEKCMSAVWGKKTMCEVTVKYMQTLFLKKTKTNKYTSKAYIKQEGMV